MKLFLVLALLCVVLAASGALAGPKEKAPKSLASLFDPPKEKTKKVAVPSSLRGLFDELDDDEAGPEPSDSEPEVPDRSEDFAALLKPFTFFRMGLFMVHPGDVDTPSGCAWEHRGSIPTDKIGRQGYKMHVSAKDDETALEMLAVVVPMLVERTISFKIARYEEWKECFAGSTNLVGKLVTVYPELDEHGWTELAQALVDALKTLKADVGSFPVAPHEASVGFVGSGVSVRYGAYDSSNVLRVNKNCECYDEDKNAPRQCTMGDVEKDSRTSWRPTWVDWNPSETLHAVSPKDRRDVHAATGGALHVANDAHMLVEQKKEQPKKKIKTRRKKHSKGESTDQ